MIETILVQIASNLWTCQAVHLASALARNHGAQLVLLRTIPVRHPSYLGSDVGSMPMTSAEYADLRNYEATAEDYGVSLVVASMQCLSVRQAVIEAADQLKAQVVFAYVPESRIPYWQQYQVWRLKHGLKHCTLYTLTSSTNYFAWAPFITNDPPVKVKP